MEHLGIRLDRTLGEASVAGRLLALTAAEFRLLECLLQEPGRIFHRKELIDAITQGQAVVEERTVDVHVCALRRKLGDAQLIETVRGIGYRVPASQQQTPQPS